MSLTLQSVRHKSFVFCDTNDPFIEINENGMSVRL